MNRDYTDGEHDDVELFFGTEIENTPAKGMLTLFVVGIQPVGLITKACANRGIKHIYLGANHSFVPSDTHGFGKWFDLIDDLNREEEDYLITIDLDLQYVGELQEWGLFDEWKNVIPVISVKMPFAQELNYNTCIKIDDVDFNATNPGVWVHSLHDLKSKETFTPWYKYNEDIPL